MLTTKRQAFLAAALSLFLLLTSACGSANGASANEVDMGVADFKQHSITIKAGQAVHFVDPTAGGGTHVLCIGKGEQCESQPGAPAELDNAQGIVFNAGDPPRDIVFSTPGTYDVICTIHPGMVVTVTVQ